MILDLARMFHLQAIEADRKGFGGLILSREYYEGDFPSITIHYRPQDRQKAERVRCLVESGRLNEDAPNNPLDLTLKSQRRSV